MTNTEKETLLSGLGISMNTINSGTSTGTQWLSTTETNKLSVPSPVDGALIAEVEITDLESYRQVVTTAQAAFRIWKQTPAPKRGEIVRQIGDELRIHKAELGKLVSWEMGKIYQEGLGEVQEMIDICDFAVGLSRQLYGLTMHSERPGHRMYEQWHPIGIVGIISAFNFPVAVWAWNSMIAAVCGDVTIWKPSEKTPLTAIACMHIISTVLKRNQLPEGIFCLISGGMDVGKRLVEDTNVPLISATGSTRMGKIVGQTVAARLGKSLLELGGNNAIILSPEADLKLAIPAIVFGAVGTCGQRCTTTRRLIIHSSIYDKVLGILKEAYQSLSKVIGDPRKDGVLIGPLIDPLAVTNMQDTLAKVKAEGGHVVFGGQVLSGEGYESGTYVVPAIVEAKNEYPSVQHETFAPILYLLTYETIEEAIAIQNGVPQGLSSSMFTRNLQEAEQFLSASGSDCGIANINIGTSGAEIGGAFGGEKETGGGRESGSDAWKAYMRRQTNTINYSNALPLAQGIKFEF
ncbi:MAG: aldehyde dehydrogenase family protein [Sphingobacteriia bacterium]|nr:aldehyde dehydrogenase family protein [Sphingobacteriia bacterium]